MKRFFDWYIIKWIFIGAFLGKAASDIIFKNEEYYFDLTGFGIIIGIYIWYQNKKVRTKK